MEIVGKTRLEEWSLPRDRVVMARSRTPPATVTLGFNIRRPANEIIEKRVPFLDTTRADPHTSCPMCWAIRRTTALPLLVNHGRRGMKTRHTTQHGLNRRLAYEISIRSSGHGGGLSVLGMLSKADIQTGLEDLFVRTPRKALLAHDTRSKSIGCTRENIYRRHHRISCRW